MPDTQQLADASASPLEAFMRSYLDTVDGVWDEIEPQVYDVLLPDAAKLDGGMIRVTFDPEALPEHPAAQFASFGTPFIDQLLANAVGRGRLAHFFMVGLNLSPHDLAGRVGRAMTLPAPLELVIDHVRALHFTQAVFWCQADFVSDQREQEIVPVGMDLHHGREVRHLDKLLEHSRLAAEPAQPLPDARRMSVAAAYRLARAQVVRTIAALAHGRSRALGERLDRQEARMRQYYADLRSELDEHVRRARDKDEAAARLPERRAALTREEEVRIAELRQKSTLQIHLRLLQLLLIQQPKLLVRCRVTAAGSPPIPLELAWDPLTEAPEAPLCPTCRHPSYIFDVSRMGQLICPSCPTAAPAGRPRKVQRG